MRLGLLYQLDALEQTHDFEDSENFDDSKDPVSIAGRSHIAPSNTFLKGNGSAMTEFQEKLQITMSALIEN
jgi:hypothetical protein